MTTNQFDGLGFGVRSTVLEANTKLQTVLPTPNQQTSNSKLQTEN